MESGDYEKNTGRLPDWWHKKPREAPGDVFYITAFWELSTCRAFGMSLGPIPWNYIVQYADRRGLDDRMSRVFEYVIRELDEVYLRDLKTK